MKKLIFYTVFVSVFFMLISMKPDATDRFVKFKDNLFVSIFEITNGEYKLLMFRSLINS